MSPRGPTPVHQLKVTLLEINPPIWRRLQVSSSINLRRLHDVIQEAMGWTQSHLYRFEVDGLEFGEPDPDFGLPIRSAKANQLRKIAPEAGIQFLYEYDFGDSWEHQIVVEQVLPPSRAPPTRGVSPARGPARQKTAAGCGATRSSCGPFAIAGTPSTGRC